VTVSEGNPMESIGGGSYRNWNKRIKCEIMQCARGDSQDHCQLNEKGSVCSFWGTNTELTCDSVRGLI